MKAEILMILGFFIFFMIIPLAPQKYY